MDIYCLFKERGEKKRTLFKEKVWLYQNIIINNEIHLKMYSECRSMNEMNFV